MAPKIIIGKRIYAEDRRTYISSYELPWKPDPYNDWRSYPDYYLLSLAERVQELDNKKFNIADTLSMMKDPVKITILFNQYYNIL